MKWEMWQGALDHPNGTSGWNPVYPPDDATWLPCEVVEHLGNAVLVAQANGAPVQVTRDYVRTAVIFRPESPPDQPVSGAVLGRALQAWLKQHPDEPWLDSCDRRMALLGCLKEAFCEHCGTEGQGCRCWDDS